MFVVFAIWSLCKDRDGADTCHSHVSPHQFVLGKFWFPVILSQSCRLIVPSISSFLSNLLFFVLIQPFLLPSKSSRSPKTTPPHRSILLLLLWCLQWLPWIWWHSCVFLASILTSTASSHFSCGALEFRWVIKYTLLASSSSYHSPNGSGDDTHFLYQVSFSFCYEFAHKILFSSLCQ